MPVDVIWDDEVHSLMRYVFDGSWEWDEFRPIVDKADAMSRTVSHRVDIIADLTNSASLPVRNAFPTLKYMADCSADNVLAGIFVVVGSGALITAMFSAYRRVFPHLGAVPYMTQTLEEARQMIAADRG
jgi:hypothetical protein